MRENYLRDLDDDSAYMMLVTANAQGELTPIERGRHALGSSMDVKAYAESVGRAQSTVQQETRAARVAADAHVGIDLSGQFKTLVEIHGAPTWLWSALVNAMVEGDWTVEQTRRKIAALAIKKGSAGGTSRGDELPPYLDIAEGLVAGAVKVSDIDRVIRAERDLTQGQRAMIAAEFSTLENYGDATIVARPLKVPNAA
jgi:ParB-like chromosome segregation protein Spo0J